MDKNDARGGRLSMRKTNEEVFRKKYQTETFSLCAEQLKAFGDCARENGFMVTFRCQDQNRASMKSFL